MLVQAAKIIGSGLATIGLTNFLLSLIELYIKLDILLLFLIIRFYIIKIN